MGYSFSVSTAYVDGGKGAVDLANKIINNKKKTKLSLLYDVNDSIYDKIDKVCKEIYGARDVIISDKAKEKIAIIKKNHLLNLPICVAKTQYSFSDDKNKYGVPTDFDVTVKDVNLYNGAGFITVLLGDIMTMPGLSRVPNYEKIDVVDGEIVNLS